MKWKRVDAGHYVAGRYSITAITVPGTRGWLLELDGSVFTLQVPSRFKTIRDAQDAAAIDERKRQS